MTEQPLVSVIIPLYNAEVYVAQCIESVLAQTWKNLELIIIDDGSKDKSVEIAKKFESVNVKIFSQVNKGASAARNYGLKEANGAYVQFLDADDLLSPDKIAAQVALLLVNIEYVSVCSTVHFKNGDDHLALPVSEEWYNTGSDDPADFLLKLYAGGEVLPGYGGMIQPNAWLTPRKILDEAGPWNEFKCPDDDGEYFCRVVLAAKGVKFSEGINYYRKHDDGKSLSAQRSREAIKNMLLAINLKYGYLETKTASPLLNPIFAKHYWELGLAAYPQFKSISKTAILKAKTLGYSGAKYTSGKLGTLLSKIFGWRLLRYFSYFKHGF